MNKDKIEYPKHSINLNQSIYLLNIFEIKNCLFIRITYCMDDIHDYQAVLNLNDEKSENYEMIKKFKNFDEMKKFIYETKDNIQEVSKQTMKNEYLNI